MSPLESVRSTWPDGHNVRGTERGGVQGLGGHRRTGSRCTGRAVFGLRPAGVASEFQAGCSPGANSPGLGALVR